MRLFCSICIALVATCLPTTISEQQALFVKNDVIENGKRVTRQTSADQMVQNILQWLQGVYTQNSRRIRQGSLREYLPPVNTQKPRPFEPVPQGTDHPGYPPAGSITPQPPFEPGSIYPSIHPEITPPIQTPDYNGYPTPSKPSYPPPTAEYPNTNPTGPTGYPTTGYPNTGYPNTGYPGTGTGYPNTGYPSPSPSFPSPNPHTGYPNPSTGYPTPSTGYPSPNPTYPSPSTGYPTPGPSYPNPSTGYPNPSTGYPTPSTGYPTPRPGYPTPSPGYPTPSPGYPTPSPGYPTPSPGYPTPSQGYPTPSPGYPNPSTGYPNPSTGYPMSSPRPFPTGPAVTSYPTHQPTTPGETESPYTSHPSHPSSPSTDDNLIPSGGEHHSTSLYPGGVTEHSTVGVPGDDDDKHPPHIHAIDVECSKEMMTINIEFNRQFDGIIYSKGYFHHPECRYVNENSGKVKYSFSVSLNSCGTEFINAFDTQGQSYLENVLVLQNEAGIQEVWDTIRAVRCLWEGNLKKSLNVALSVGMLNQEIVTFSGDTAMARLDIQLGKGPFAQPANGLVKIGEVMTLVVSVMGDPGFDIQVKDCRAKEANGENVVALTNDRGCILKPKLFGAFQKTRNTGNTGASIIAYAYFSAFKFPDVMDLILECNVDLCKTDCEVCPEPGQQIDPGRRRKRDLYMQNVTNSDNSVTMGKMLRVILPEDLNESQTTIQFTQNEGICMSTYGFVISSAVLISLLTTSCLFSAYIWLKYQSCSYKK